MAVRTNLGGLPFRKGSNLRHKCCFLRADPLNESVPNCANSPTRSARVECVCGSPRAGRGLAQTGRSLPTLLTGARGPQRTPRCHRSQGPPDPPSPPHWLFWVEISLQVIPVCSQNLETPIKSRLGPRERPVELKHVWGRCTGLLLPLPLL